jgi:AcrB/AcrD/AcrF family
MPTGLKPGTQDAPPASSAARCFRLMAAGDLRLRPIVMTSVAFIAGCVPLLLAHAADSEVREVKRDLRSAMQSSGR